VATLFTRLINGELPGCFVWRDPQCVAFLALRPLRPGHTLVVPIREVDHWLDADPELLKHVTGVCQSIGRALQHGFQPVKIGLMVAGLEVPHMHIHVVPIRAVHDLDFANQDMNAKPEDLDRAADTIRASLRTLGFRQVADR
jgi:histidine triad (HIT) family protein